LKELFSEFGKVLSTKVEKPKIKSTIPALPNAKAPTAIGYVLFEHKEEADKAME
jgi:RNA recognition motif-containing protein